MRILTYASDASLPVVLAYLPDDWEVVECRDLDEACVATTGAALVLVEQGTTERGLVAADALWERGVTLPCLVIGEAAAPPGARPEVLVRPFTLQDLTRAMEQAATFAPVAQATESARAPSEAPGWTEPPGGAATDAAQELQPEPSLNGAVRPESEVQTGVETPLRTVPDVPDVAQDARAEHAEGARLPPEGGDSGAPTPPETATGTEKRPSKPGRRAQPELSPEPISKPLATPPKAAPEAAKTAEPPVAPVPAAASGAVTADEAAPAPVVSAPPEPAAAPVAPPGPTPAAPAPERELRRLTVRKTGERVGLGRLVGRRPPGARPVPATEEASPRSPLLERIKVMVGAGRQLETLLEEMPALGNPRTIAHAFLEEIVETLQPEIAAVYAPRSDGMYGVLAGHGLTKTEYGMKVPADQSLFVEVTNGLHGVLVAPVDLAQGLVSGIGGARTEALIAAPLSVADQCFAIAIAGRNDFSEVDLQRFTDLAADAAPGIALAQLIERLRSR